MGGEASASAVPAGADTPPATSHSPEVAER